MTTFTLKLSKFMLEELRDIYFNRITLSIFFQRIVLL